MRGVFLFVCLARAFSGPRMTAEENAPFSFSVDPSKGNAERELPASLTVKLKKGMEKSEMTASEIRDIIAQANGNGVNPTCDDLAKILSKRSGKEIWDCDVKEELDEMEANGMISKIGNGYIVNSSCNL